MRQPRKSSGRPTVQLDAADEFRQDAMSLVVPPMVPEAYGVDEAVAAYPTLRVPLAEDVGGQVLSWNPRSVPHLLISGDHGSGKTVTLQNLGAQLARAHWAVHIAGGEREYHGFRDWPNVRCVATHTDDQVALIDHLVSELLAQRQWSVRVADAGREFAPAVLLVDSVPALTENIAAEQPERKQRAIDGLNTLLIIGREFRVHVVIAGTRHGLPGQKLSDATLWGAAIAFNAVELPLILNPYRDRDFHSRRDLAVLRPARSSYPPADLA
jgi:DNA translocase FtsK/SpoIIIE-like protein